LDTDPVARELTIGAPVQDLPAEALHWYLPGSFTLELPEGRTTYVHVTERTPACQLGTARGPGALRLGLDYLISGQDTSQGIRPDRSMAYGNKLYLLSTISPAQLAGARLLSFNALTGGVTPFSSPDPFQYTRPAHLFVAEEAVWFTCDRGVVRVDRFAGEFVLYEWTRYHRSVPMRKTLMFCHGDDAYFCHEGDVYRWRLEYPDVTQDSLVPCGFHLLISDTLWSASNRSIFRTYLESRSQTIYELPGGSNLSLFGLAATGDALWVLVGTNAPLNASSALGWVDLKTLEFRRVLSPQLGAVPARSIDVSEGYLWLGTERGVIRIDPSYINLGGD
jgi:hypothetical protein